MSLYLSVYHVSLPDRLNTSYQALRPGGVLAVWSAGTDHAFDKRLRKTGFEVEEIKVRARGRKGSRHRIWIARTTGR